ncbi:MAG TPA: hypothetical protein VGK26_05305 [Thermoanaerobaculia bacterium]|jgi:hypothetical protein
MIAIVPALLGVLALTVGDGGSVHAPSPASLSVKPAPEPCASPEHHQFDFWQGDWEVREAGKVAGTNRISRVLGGCALREEWAGADGGKGTSLNVYDSALRRWHQTWVDDKGLVLLLEGEWRGGRMVLEGERPTLAAEGASRTTRERISWTPQNGGRVRQLWESSSDAGKTWQVVFDGIYAPKKS